MFCRTQQQRWKNHIYFINTSMHIICSIQTKPIYFEVLDWWNICTIIYAIASILKINTLYFG